MAHWHCCHFGTEKSIKKKLFLSVFLAYAHFHGAVCQRNFLYYPKKLVAQAVIQKALGNATNILESMYNEYGLNRDIFEEVQYRKFFNQFPLITCLYNIKSTHSLEPVFVLWHSMGLLMPLDFLYEYALLIFFIYKDVLLYVASSVQHRSSTYTSLTHLLEKTTEFYTKIESLPLQEIILIINLLSEEVPHIIHENMGEPSSNWYEWFRTHLWKISVAVLTLLLRVMVIFKEGDSVEHTTQLVKQDYYEEPIIISRKNNEPKKDDCISRILFPLR